MQITCSSASLDVESVLFSHFPQMLLNFIQLGILWRAKRCLFPPPQPPPHNMVLVKSTLVKIKQNIDAQVWNEHIQSLFMQNPAETPKELFLAFVFSQDR